MLAICTYKIATKHVNWIIFYLGDVVGSIELLIRQLLEPLESLKILTKTTGGSRVAVPDRARYITWVWVIEEMRLFALLKVNYDVLPISCTTNDLSHGSTWSDRFDSIFRRARLPRLSPNTFSKKLPVLWLPIKLVQPTHRKKKLKLFYDGREAWSWG